MIGPLKGPVEGKCTRIFWNSSGPYPIWARARMGPARARMRAKSSRNNQLFFLLFKRMFIKNLRFWPPYHVFHSFNLFLRFLAEIRFRTIMTLPQKAFSRTKMCSFRTSVTLPGVTLWARLRHQGTSRLPGNCIILYFLFFVLDLGYVWFVFDVLGLFWMFVFISKFLCLTSQF